MMLFEEQLHVELPDSFQEMKEDRIHMMYPYENKPQIIFEDKEKHRFSTFSLLKEQELADNQVEYAVKMILKVVTSLYPDCLLDEARLTECVEGRCGWFSFKCAGADGELFHIMYIYPVNGSMMLGTLGCNTMDETGKQQLMEIMKSLKGFRKIHKIYGEMLKKHEKRGLY